MSIVMLCMGTTSAFATTEDTSKADALSTASQVTTDVSVDTDERALGKILASGTTTINGGTGTLQVTLPSNHSNVYFIAQIGYQDQNVPVVCTVRDPKGNLHKLGTIIGNGSSTSAYPVSYATAGTYSFYFSTALNTPYIVMAYIRE